MTPHPSFAARYWAALTGSHPPGRRVAGPTDRRFGRRFLAALTGVPAPGLVPADERDGAYTLEPIPVRLFVPPGRSSASVTVFETPFKGPIVTVGRSPARWSRWLPTTVLSVLAAVAAAVIPIGYLSDDSGAGSHLGVVVKPAEIVVLIDESGSVVPDDLAREREAAALIAASELSPDSTVTVLGFASDDTGTGSAVDVVCPRMKSSGAAEREQFAGCIQKPRAWPPGEGVGGDHAQALAHAVAQFGPATTDTGPRLVFLLTDGRLDVIDSPEYGATAPPDVRTRTAMGRLKETLAVARDKHVQIWPIGFGTADRGELDEYAAGGYRTTCRGPAPEAHMAGGSGELPRAVVSTLATSRCTGSGQVRSVPLVGRDEVQLPVTVPAHAVAVSIIVLKGDSVVAAKYFDPSSAEVTKAGPGASGAVSTQFGAVEVLRLTTPKPGVWHVRLTPPVDVGKWEVSASVAWATAIE
ncbi:hypothetical protein FHS29_003596 [Saccharothrix tamanrassetensis]|uniref:VWFA domain-containing protein n=1 Tax=Saccharothrix tamanrassetensis TaxID=1051531 RepID=A0A841CJ45_9PSEU|nr:vWA domain-containing protein [Saccharothrix tamanrassetensis]MBB5957003.1 hypothetical protein [Saccharothrix tamanrassetensis]